MSVEFSSMKVAIVHYHLRGGGVTRVVSHQVALLRERGVSTVTVVGEGAQVDFSCGDVRVLPELAYDDRRSSAECRGAGERLLAVCREALGGPPDLIHVHNHSLGKNAALPTAVEELAAVGQALVLQLHDFAEDWRVRNFTLLRDRFGDGRVESLTGRLYPNRGNVHYAVLNRRDADFLVRAGVVEGRVHVVPNAVSLELPDAAGVESAVPWGEGRRLFVYPTRGIRRKNTGEFLLWAAMADAPEDVFAMTLAPKNPVEREFYDPWVEYAQERNLPVVFELMSKVSIPFSEVLRRAEAVVTTSVTEGFGLAFLEPWLVGTRLLGRNLPEITGGFDEVGIDLDALYDELTVPASWCGGVNAVVAEFMDRITRTLRRFDAGFDEADLLTQCRRLVVDGRIDFGRLDERNQRRVIEQLLADPGARAEVRPGRLDCDADGAAADVERVMGRNRAIALDDFSLARIGERWQAVYEAVAGDGDEDGPPVSVRALLECYLAPERFRMLRT